MRWMMLSFTVLLGGLLGCAHTHRMPVRDTEEPYQKRTRVQVESRTIRPLIAVDKAVVEREESGLLRVRLAIRNKTRDDIWVDIRTVFTDEQGLEAEKTNWEPFLCTARTVETYDVRSLGSQVRDYRVLIRDPKESEPMP